jgi:hypothetical protein
MKITHHYCTYFDNRYLPRAIALYQSLINYDKNFILWALCFDDQSYRRLIDLNFPGVRPISLADFLSNDQELVKARNNRSFIEFYFTCSPSLPLYVFNNDSSVEQVTYLDADLYFFHDPEPIFQEIGVSSVAIIPHRFPKQIAYLQSTGIYNVGWITVRRDAEGLACLYRWRDQCLDWCYDRIEGTRYADQGYLNEWPDRYKNLVILQHKGANLAPWNLKNHEIHTSNRTVLVDTDPLVFFHFQSLARVSVGIYKLNYRRYRVIPSSFIKKNIYAPYIKLLEKILIEYEINNTDERFRSPTDTRFLFSFKRGASIISLFKNNIMILVDKLLGDYIDVKDYSSD